MDLRLLVIIVSGVFAVGTLAAAWRSRSWLMMDLTDFKVDFARTIVVADKVQPALAVIAIGAIAAYVLGSSEQGEGFAIGAGLILLSTILVSLAILVPLQRRIINKSESNAVTDALRSRWIRGHAIRTGAAVAAFSLATLV